MAGIALGSLAVNAWSLQGSALPAVVLGCALATALGSALQALVAAQFTRRLEAQLEPADPLGGIKSAVVATAPACPIAATAGATALYLAGLVPRSEWAPTWLVWGLGDWLGMMALGQGLILVTAPAAALARPRPPARSPPACSALTWPWHWWWRSSYAPRRPKPSLPILRLTPTPR
ncbi:MAG: MASE1 domain-containing protein [Candidatus Handelsmanbacteria bacterium]|nr:MASE1 domain-containing protein [Candidatus Handelsmanbacteria bacterium]